MSTTTRTRVVGPEVWLGSDLATTDDWVLRLSRSDVAELTAALARVRARGLSMGEVGPEDFALPTLRSKLIDVVRELEHGRGFVVLRGLPVGELSDDDAAMIYWGIGTHMGTCVRQNAAGDLLGHVYDQGLDFAETNVRGYTTRDHLPFHTDGSDAVGLLCLRTAKRGGTSSLASSMHVHNTLLEEAPDVLETFYDVWHFDKRNEGLEPGESPTFTSPVFSEYDGHVSCRYVPGILRSAPEKRGVALTPEQARALDLFDDIVGRPGVALDMELQPGDMQFVSNYSVLHSRTRYEDWPEPERKRHLLRLWLTLHSGRALADDFNIQRSNRRFG